MLADSQVSSDWLRAPNEQDRRCLVEYTRGVLYGLSFISDGQGCRVRPVHVSRLRNAFDDLGAPSLYRVGLRLLALLGEAEKMFGGFWLMAPFRVLNLNSRFAFIGAVPAGSALPARTSQLGLARYLPEAAASKFLTQSVEGWMGSTNYPYSDHIANFVRTHREHASPALESHEIEYLTLAAQRSHSKRAIWSREPSAILSRENIAVCRQADQGIYRYFSAELAGKSIVTEATLRQSIPRLTFAFAAEAGTPFRVASKSMGETIGHLEKPPHPSRRAAQC